MESRSQIEDRAAAFLAKRDSGDWSDHDQASLAKWMAASTAHRVALLRLEAVWEEARRLKPLSAGLRPGTVPPPGEWRRSPFFSRNQSVAESMVGEAGSAALEVDRTEGEERKELGHGWRRTRRWKIFASAASLLVTLGIGAYLALVPRPDRYVTPIGGVDSVPLQDGSNVTLNTATQVRVELTPAARYIKLDRGEAFFEVAKDPGRPFIVQVDNRRVIAVGTKFSVRRIGSDIRVAVIEGKVRVEDSPSGPSTGEAGAAIFLTPGTIATTENSKVLVREKPLAEVEDDLSWRRGYLTFHNTSLADAVAEFNRYNTHQIAVRDAKTASIRISGTFRAINYQAFVRMLDDGFSIHATNTGDETTLTSNSEH
jgi:transmembrane sensor